MSEDINENNEQNTNINVNKDYVNNLANNLLKGQNSLDLGSIMQMATSLLNNDKLLSTVTELSKNKEQPTPPVAEVSEKQENAELTSFSAVLETIANDISELKKEILEAKEQNKYLSKLVKRYRKSIQKKK